MLYQRGGCKRPDMGVHIKGRSVLGHVPEYFSNAAVNEATKPGRISDPAVVEAHELASTRVGGTWARHISPPQFARVDAGRLRRLIDPSVLFLRVTVPLRGRGWLNANARPTNSVIAPCLLAKGAQETAESAEISEHN